MDYCLAASGDDDRSQEERPSQSNTRRTRPFDAQTSSQPQNPPPPLQQHPCPRCGSTQTKFCYYNNYSLSQPRYLCKGCRRYWTQGGSLRNVPVGGGSRKPKRPKLSSPPQLQSSQAPVVNVPAIGNGSSDASPTLPNLQPPAPSTSASLAPSPLTYQMINLINPNYEHQLPGGGCGAAIGFEGGFFSSLMAVQGMGAVSQSIHPTANYHALMSTENSSTNTGSDGLFGFSPVDRDHGLPVWPAGFSAVGSGTIDQTPPQVDPPPPMADVDTRFWSVAATNSSRGVAGEGDKIIKDDYVGSGGSTGGASAGVPRRQ